MDSKCLIYIFTTFILSECNNESRIISGIVSQPKQFKFVVAIKIMPERSICTGSIITKKWVITAAHCFRLAKGRDLDQDLVPRSASKIWAEIRAGTVDFDHVTRATQERTCVRHVVHDINPERKEWDANNDVALVEVDEPFVFNDYVNSVNIAKRFPRVENFKCLAMGFGWAYANTNVVIEVIEGYGKNSHLFHIHVTAGDYVYCRKKSPTRKWGKEHLCADPVKRGTATCSGDSGGPLLCNGLLVGTLYGKKHTNPTLNTQPCATSGNFQVYMLLSFYEVWIRKYVDDLPSWSDLVEIDEVRNVENEPGRTENIASLTFESTRSSLCLGLGIIVVHTLNFLT